MDIVLYPHEILRTRTKRLSVEQMKSEGFRRRISSMFEAMYRRGGVGLAAPQVGWNSSVIVGNPLGRPHHEAGAFILINPQIIPWGEQDVQEEGCLSLPGLWAPVKRHVGVTVQFMDWDAKERELKVDGFKARIIQHEFDHLHGTIFTDRLDEVEQIKIRPVMESYLSRIESYRVKVAEEEANRKKREAEEKAKNEQNGKAEANPPEAEGHE